LTDKQKHFLTLGFIIILVVAAVFTIMPINKSTKLGLDLKGGLSIIFRAKDTPSMKITDAKMQQAELVLRNRVDVLGVAEPEIQREGARNIMVQLPGVKNPEQVTDLIKKPAVLRFRIVEDKYSALTETQLDKEFKKGKKVLGPVLMTGDKVSSAKATYGGQVAQQPIVDLTLNDAGARQFEDITSKNVNKRLAIVLDDTIITAPNIEQAISGGKAIIEGVKSVEEAKNIEMVLSTGSIPVELEILDSSSVGATLGNDALRAGLVAGLIGLALVAIYMLLYYQGLGLITWVGLSFYIALVWGIIAGIGRVYGWTLTLPGIAGLIISVGIAADSKIIIFERVKDELRNKKTFRTAVDSGFWHGFRTSLDADLVTFFAAAVLFFVGIGPVKGFALTLMIGIMMDIVIMLLYTRPALGLLASIWPIKSPSFLVHVRSKAVAENA
jgi:preprotein translocase subunit SecD